MFLDMQLTIDYFSVIAEFQLQFILHRFAFSLQNHLLCLIGDTSILKSLMTMISAFVRHLDFCFCIST